MRIGSFLSGLRASGALALLFGVLISPAIANDFPTSARADYVLACMAANGQTRNSLDRCSCSIDAIANILTYEKYVQAETVLSISRTPSHNAEVFRSSAMLGDMVADLRRAQAEAEITCFP